MDQVILVLFQPLGHRPFPPGHLALVHDLLVQLGPHLREAGAAQDDIVPPAIGREDLDHVGLGVLVKGQVRVKELVRAGVVQGKGVEDNMGQREGCEGALDGLHVAGGELVFSAEGRDGFGDDAGAGEKAVGEGRGFGWGGFG